MSSPACRLDPRILACSWVEASSTGISKTFGSPCSSVTKILLKLGRVDGTRCLKKMQMDEQLAIVGHVQVVLNIPALDHDLIDHSGTARWGREPVT